MRPVLENSLLSGWMRTLSKHGGEPAVFGRSGQVLRSFGEIEREAVELASRFEERVEGEVIAIQVGNSESLPALLLGLWRKGLIPLLLGQHLEASQLGHALKSAHASGLVTFAGNLKFESIGKPVPIEWGGRKPQFLKLTSGTTALPRVVKFQGQQLLADCLNICASMGFGPADVNFGVIPFAHSYGFSNLITPLLACGVPLVVSGELMPRAILADLIRTRASVFAGTPVIFQKLVEMPNPPALPDLRLCISAGALLPVALKKRFHEVYGLRLHTFYGASECGGIAYDSAGELEREQGYVGRALEGVELEFGVGSVTIRGGAVGDGYYPAQPEDPLRDGQFVPSDVIRNTADGMVIEGRASDVINIGGRKLNPLELEQRLAQCPGVKQVVVFGVPSALRGEEPVACVVAECDPASILRFCQMHFSAWQTPKDVWLVDEIPVSERGKVSRRAMAALYEASRSASPP